MKTTLDLPDQLIKRVKLHALRKGRKLKDAVADLLRKGLETAAKTTPSTASFPGVKTNPKTGLPYFPSAPSAPITKMRIEEIYALIHQTEEKEDIERSGLCL